MSNPSFSSQEKAELVKRHLREGTPVSDLCVEKSIDPHTFHQWIEQFFKNGAAAFETGARRGPGRPPKHAPEARIRELESKIALKDEVLGELMTEHLALKKKLGLR